MRTPIPRKKRSSSDVDTKRVDLTTGIVVFPRANKRTGLGSGHLLNGNPVVQDFFTSPPEPTIIEGSFEDTFVCYIDTTPLGVQIEMDDDAGGRFKLVGREIHAGPVLTDYETATSHVITATAGVGMYAYTKNFTIQVIDVDDAPPGGDNLTDENLDPLRDQNNVIMWE